MSLRSKELSDGPHSNEFPSCAGTFLSKANLTQWLQAGLLTLCTISVQGSEYFVATDGKPDGDGSQLRPWDLATGLAHPRSVQPGDTIWLRGGTYVGGFTSRLRGAANKSIVLRQAMGERATIDCREEKRSALFVVDGDWTTFWGFELTCSDPRRISALPGHGDMNRGGIHCRASHVKFINLVVHDTGGAFGLWSEGEGGEVYGCIAYNNGWRGPDRTHGHAIYAQNKRGTKRLLDNILFHQFQYGIHVYGSEKAALEGFHIEGNIAFDNGLWIGHSDRAPNIHVGGGTAASRIILTDNYTYHSTAGTNVRLGSRNQNEDLVCRNNVFAGIVDVIDWKKITMTNNQFIGPDSLIALDVSDRANVASYSWDENEYVSLRQRYPPFVLRQGAAALASSWGDWQRSGLDRQGEYREGPLQGQRVFVRPNQYEPGRAHIVVYNWDRHDEVVVNLGDAMPKGTKFKIVSPLDYFGRPLVEGHHDGSPIRLSMKSIWAPKPIGLPDAQLPDVGREFAIFVVLPGGGPAKP